MSRALVDLGQAIALRRVWFMLGWNDVRQRYRRSVIGPLWITLSMGVMIVSMGVVYGSLLHQDRTTFLPFLASGFVAWFFIGACVSDATVVFTQAEALLKQGGLPIALHVFRILWRNTIILAHNMIVMVIVYAWTGHAPWQTLILEIPALLLVSANLLWIALVLAPLCARFRDLPLIVGNVLQMLFFVTPIVYRPELLHQVEWIVDINPFYYLVQGLRGPLLGEGIAANIYLPLLVFAVIGSAAAIVVFARVRGRIAYWV